jgi:deoxyadenosine/deoxycytidine kinase
MKTKVFFIKKSGSPKVIRMPKSDPLLKSIWSKPIRFSIYLFIYFLMKNNNNNKEIRQKSRKSVFLKAIRFLSKPIRFLASAFSLHAYSRNAFADLAPRFKRFFSCYAYA